MKVVILCGGKGTRLKEQTEQKPKPLVEIGGKPILWHIMKIYAEQGFNHFVLALGYKGEMIKDYFMNYDWKVNDFILSLHNKEVILKNRDKSEDWTIEFIDTGEESLTSLRLNKLKERLAGEENFMLTYSDAVADINLQELLDLHLQKNKLITLTGFSPKYQYGVVCLDQDNIITEFQEKPVLDLIINGGFMVFNQKIFNWWDDRDIMLEDVLPEFSQRREIALYHHKGFWKSLDTYKDFLDLNELWLKDPKWKTWDKKQDKKIDNVLITGGAGFVGSHLSLMLLESGYNVSVLDKGENGLLRLEGFLDKINYYDIEKINLEEIFKENKFDCIIHLATYYKKNNETAEDIRKMNEVNILFPSTLLDLAVKYKINYFVNAGTFFEYFISSQAKITEHTPIEPYNLYASTKISFEAVLKNYCQNKGLKAITLKLFSPFGEKDNEKVMVKIIESHIRGEVVDLTAGTQQWNFTYVEDVVSAFVKAIEYLPKMKEDYDFFNIGYDVPVSIKQATEFLEEITNKKFLANWGAIPYPANEIFYVNCDNSKAKNILDWKEKYNFKKGLLKMYSYYLKKYDQGSF